MFMVMSMLQVKLLVELRTVWYIFQVDDVKSIFAEKV